MCQAIKDIRQEGKDEGREEALLDVARALMKKLGLTPEQTLELMDTPFTEQLAYRLQN